MEEELVVEKQMGVGMGVKGSSMVLRLLLACFVSGIKKYIDEESTEGVASVIGMGWTAVDGVGWMSMAGNF